MQEWRWDQGRILYFQYDVLKEIARVLCRYDGKNVNDNEIAAEFKADLIRSVGLPFAPENYKVNRNYSRVFQCSMLATAKGKKESILVVSDICRQLASDDSIFESADDYFLEIVNRFRFPFPAFLEYNTTAERVYPFVAIVKYLIALKVKGEEASLSLQDIASVIVGNNCIGTEDIEFYKNLTPTNFNFDDKTLRQVREMVVFIGQLSFLKIFDRKIFLDVLSIEDAMAIFDGMLKPYQHTPLEDKVEEFESITRLNKQIIIPASIKTNEIPLPTIDSSDIEFVEGKRKRVYHLRIERSPLLRKIYIQLHPEPICDACKIHIKEKYPWVDYMLDLHHLLPLSSVVRTSDMGTSLEDLVGLCPSCHRAIHSYYNKWLKSNSQEDFKSKKEAMEVYLNAIKEIA